MNYYISSVELIRAMNSGSKTIPPLCLRGAPGTVFISPQKRLLRKRMFGEEEDEGLPNRREDATEQDGTSTVPITGTEDTHE